MPFATVNSGPHQIVLHYELLVGECAWEEMVARERDQQHGNPGGSPSLTGEERQPLSPKKWDLAERGAAVEGSLVAAAAERLDLQQQAGPEPQQERVLFIPGLASKTTTGWFEQQVRFVTALKDGAGRPLVCACILDNRGVGRSGVPVERSHYSTDIMCADVLGLLDHLGWQERVHVVGMSLGALVALKLAAAAPQRIRSVTITGAVLSGLQMLWSGWKNAPKQAYQYFFGALRSKIRSNIEMNYTARYLAELTEGCETRLEAMAAATEADIRRKKGTVPAEARRRNMAGRRGQMRATLRHRLSAQEVAALVGADHFRPVIVYGWQDGFITPNQVAQLAKTVRANMVATEAAHAGIGIEAAAVVNRVLEGQIRGGYPAPRPAGGGGGGAGKEGLLLGGGAARLAFHLQASSVTSGRREQGPACPPHGRLVKRVQTLPS